MSRLLSKIAVAVTFLTFLFGGVASLLLTAFLFVCPQTRWLMAAYVFWIFFGDRHVPESGGRRSELLLTKLPIWELAADYFSLQTICVPRCDLKPLRNYLFACFPHGVIPIGVNTSHLSKKGFRKLFPHHNIYQTTLGGLFLIPFYREYVMANGGVSVSLKSIRWLLDHPKGGNIVCVHVGGAGEALHCQPGNYHLLLKNRRGFVRVALESGVALVPVFTFGEIELFEQWGANNALLKKCQRFAKNLVGFAPVFVKGTGLFQDSFGILPKPKPLTVLVGEPIPVQKTENPTAEQIEDLHGRFVEAIVALFENNKRKYLENADEIKLVLE